MRRLVWLENNNIIIVIIVIFFWMKFCFCLSKNTRIDVL